MTTSPSDQGNVLHPADAGIFGSLNLATDLAAKFSSPTLVSGIIREDRFQSG
jgi:hypothetical protein